MVAVLRLLGVYHDVLHGASRFILLQGSLVILALPRGAAT